MTDLDEIIQYLHDLARTSPMGYDTQIVLQDLIDKLEKRRLIRLAVKRAVKEYKKTFDLLASK